MLWRIAFFVEGRQLEKCLAAVTGMALNMEPPKPVVNAVAKQGKVEATSSASSKKELMANWLRTQKGKEVTTKLLTNKMAEFGGSPSSVNSGLINAYLDDKLLKRKSRAVYVVL